MPQRCVPCQAELPEHVKFCTSCGSDMLVTSVSSAAGGFAEKQEAAPQPKPAVSQPNPPIPAPAAATAAAAAPSASHTAPLPPVRALEPNTARIPMDEHEFTDFLGSLSRGLMKDADQIRKIKAAASAHHFTCAQAVAMGAVVKGHPVEAICTLYPALVDADANFGTVLQSLKWVEERQEVVDKLKLDPSKYAPLLKK